MTCEPNQESTSDVELKINGNPVELNVFVTNFIAETIAGMVKPLRGVDKVETVELKIIKKQ